MGKKNTVSHKAVGENLRNEVGFREGYDKRGKIIKLGELLRTVRENEVHLTQTEAAQLIQIEQSELSRIENGTGAQGPAWSTVTQIIDAYRDYLRGKGTEVTFSLEVSGPNHRARYSLSEENDKFFMANE
jgi:DNA-binding XRE family transcriptional regulator